MGVPRVYRKSGDQLVNYNWQDINTGTGYVTFYGFSTKNPADNSLSYALSTQQFFSSTIETVTGAINANGVSISEDYDLYFNIPTIIEGDLWAQFSIACDFNDATKLYGNVRVRKFDGTTTTNIASGLSEHITDFGAGADEKTVLAKVIVPRTLFKAGETMRVTMDITVSNYQGNPCTFTAFAHDPQDRDGAKIVPSVDDSTTTIFRLNVPFKPQI